MKNCCTLLCFIAAILCGCTYTPEGNYINPAIHPPPGEIAASINIDDIEGEFPLVVTTAFNISVDKAGKLLRSFDVTKDGKRVELLYSSYEYSFYLNPENLPDGTHEYLIKMELYSGSGSLAERMGKEIYLVQKKLIVTVDKVAPPPVSGLTARMVNGHLTLSWNKPSRRNYYYFIERHNETTNNGGSVVIKDPDVTEFVDEGFVGGKISYVVSLRSVFFDVPRETLYELNSLESTVERDNDNHVKLKWKVNDNLGENVLVQVAGRRFRKNFPPTNGEAMVDTLYLGDVAHSTVSIWRQGFEAGVLTLSHINSIGTKIKSFEEYSFLESSNKLLLHRDKNIGTTYRYDATTLTLEDSVVFWGFSHLPLLSSPDGHLQYLVSGDALLSFNPMDLSVQLAPIYLTYLVGGGIGYNWNYTLSNDNLIVIGTGNWTNSKIATIDLNTRQPWGTQIDGRKPVISADANYLVVTNESPGSDAMIYKKGSSDWEHIGKIPYGEMFFSRSPNSRLISSLDGTTKVYDLSSSPNASGYFVATASASFQTTGVDLVSNRIISESTDSKFVSTISLYAVDDLHHISTTKARTDDNYLSRKHFISGDRHLVTSGFISDIE